jgi:hypothetical protein
MELNQRLITYILKAAPVTMDKLIDVATEKGYTLDEILTALEQVHKDKRITQTANTASVVTYKLATVKERPDHLAYIRNNYPPMTPENDGSGIDVGDLSWMFLKSKEERDAFRAEMSGRPVYMVKSKYAKTNKW